MTPNSPSTPVRETTAEFTIDMSPAAPELELTGRFNFTKAWTGGIAGTGEGRMLSAGDPGSGNAGYVVLETFAGSIDGLEGGVALQQLGTMTAGASILHYEIVPGSGTDGLTGITGTIELTVIDGRHEVRLRYAKP